SIAEPIAKADPGNAGWQRDLSVSHAKIGDVLRTQGDLPAALKEFEATHEIISRLAKSDPGNARWQRDLAVSPPSTGHLPPHCPAHSRLSRRRPTRRCPHLASRSPSPRPTPEMPGGNLTLLSAICR